MDVHFEIDGLYFTEAVARLEGLSILDERYASCFKAVDDLNHKLSAIEARHEAAGTNAYDETEGDVIALSSYFDELDLAARQLVAHTVVVHILCASCLEAHINVRAAATLGARDFDEFDKLSIVGKWMLYARLFSLDAFKWGSQPSQGIQQLVRHRNRLVHFKPNSESHSKGFQPPAFVEIMRLRKVDCQASVETVRMAVSALATAEGRDPPGWLGDDWWSLFRMDYSDFID